MNCYRGFPTTVNPRRFLFEGRYDWRTGPVGRVGLDPWDERSPAQSTSTLTPRTSLATGFDSEQSRVPGDPRHPTPHNSMSAVYRRVAPSGEDYRLDRDPPSLPRRQRPHLPVPSLPTKPPFRDVPGPRPPVSSTGTRDENQPSYRHYLGVP